MPSKPVIFTLDDDPEVLQAIQRDLRREFGKDYRIMRADGGAEALDALQQMKLRNDEVALFLVDQRMPEISGVEFLGRAREFFPNAKRALLTAYADTNAAIQAINEISLDYYLMKPWDPPEEHLFPIVHDLVDQWQSTYRPAFEGLRVIGHQWSPDAHRVKDFLARNRVPYRWLDLEADPENARLISSLENVVLPVVLLSDGTPLMNPTNAQIAGQVGLKTQAAQPFYDLAIVGGGTAG
jgi:thioredoxin reductase (NADPH)